MKWLYVLVLCGVVLAENPEESGGDDVYEGDMILTADQRMAAVMGMDVDNPFGRGSTKNTQWPGGVMPYVIDSSLSRDSRAMKAIQAGMEEWTSKTCIRFQERTSESGYANFILGSGCSSHVGRIGRRQDINLARGCWHRGTVAHEIGHALGFYHEQSRPDRDNYVTIMWDNIVEKNKFNFNKYGRDTIDSLGTRYDYKSVMHYGATSFSKNGKPTIVAKQSGVTFGQRQGISPGDAEQMNLLYKSHCGGGGGGENGGGGGGGGSGCVDKHKDCGKWKRKCNKHEYVKEYCKKTCGRC